MPRFIDQIWSGYRIRVRPGDNYRKLTLAVLRRDMLPYLNGTYLIFNLIILPPKGLDNIETLKYEWRLRSLDNSQIFDSKVGYAEVVPNKKFKTKIVTDLVLDTLQYIIEVKLNRCDVDFSKEPYVTVASLTVQDSDNFYRDTLIPSVATVVYIFLAAVLGAILTLLVT